MCNISGTRARAPAVIFGACGKCGDGGGGGEEGGIGWEGRLGPRKLSSTWKTVI